MKRKKEVSLLKFNDTAQNIKKFIGLDEQLVDN